MQTFPDWPLVTSLDPYNSPQAHEESTAAFSAVSTHETLKQVRPHQLLVLGRSKRPVGAGHVPVTAIFADRAECSR